MRAGRERAASLGAAYGNAGMGETDWNLMLSEQIRRNGRLFFRLAHGVLRDAASAEDVCQHAFLRAWEQRHQIGASDFALKGWLARTVINGSLQVVRRGKVARRAVAAHVAGRGESVGPGGQQAEVREEVMAAVAKLPDPCRSVVVMRLLEGMSGGEVKDLLGCSASEVSRQLHRGMEQLRGMLAHCDASANSG